MIAQRELVHRGLRHQVFRADRHGRRLVVKQLGSAGWSADAVASLRHEFEILSGIDVPGVVRVQRRFHARERGAPAR